jgi:hypothetical protein
MSYAVREPEVAPVDTTTEGDPGRLTGVALSVHFGARSADDPHNSGLRHGYRARSVLDPPDGPPPASMRRLPMG